MSILVDNSSEPKPSSLKKRIKRVQYEPEPTLEEFYNPVPLNLRRPQRVQDAQVPVGQIEDEFTIKGREQILREKIRQAEERDETEKEKKEKLKREEREQNLWVKLFKIFPGMQTAHVAAALASGDVTQIAIALTRLQKATEAKRHKEELAQERKQKEKRKRKPKAKRQKRYKIDAKGNRVLIKKDEE